MERALVAALGVLALTVVASWFTRRRWVAVLAGTAAAFALLLPGALGSRRLLWEGLASHGGAAALLLLAGWLVPRLVARRSGTPARLPPPPAPVAFVRHWRGADGIGEALLRTLALLLAVGFVGFSLAGAPLPVFPRAVTGAVLAAWSLTVLLSLWALAGVWRAAHRHVARGGSRFAGWPVKLGALLGALVLAAAVTFDAVPDFKEYGPVAFGPPARDLYALRILRGGTEIALSGELEWGIGADFEEALARNPGVRIVHLDSIGGRIFEGQRLAESIRRRRLTTYVAHRCESACVRVLAAGEERWLSRRAVVGLHRPWGRSSLASLRRSADELTAYLASRGVDRSIGERGAATPSSKMWHPSHEEIFGAHLASRYADAGEVALSGYTAEEVATLDLSLREDRFFQALFEFDRPIFDRVVAALREGIRDGRTEAEVLGFLEDEVGKILERDLSRTSDRAAHAFYAAFLGAGRALEALGGEVCADFLETGGKGGRGRLPPPAEHKLLDAVGDVMAAAALEPRPAPEIDDVAHTLLGVYERAGERVQDLDVLSDDEAAAARPKEYCDAVLAVAEEIVALPPAEAGPLVRHLVSQ